MSTTRVEQRYGRPAVLLHWTIALLIALAYVSMNVRGPKGTLNRILWSDVHFWAGTLVLVLTVLRVMWRARAGAPPLLPQPKYLMLLSHAVHFVLYVFIFVQPVLGILTLDLQGHPLALPGLPWSLNFVGPNREQANTLFWIHKYLADTFYFVIGLHALAALWHHFVRRDGTLRRML
ncbi:cytochrome b [Paraburkholderia sp. ZP32-5]|uniref:cytochrome b n=1 Tax=Paraburkholderia sp. ZP32-5 TaxID=2883245 RepID=UPI001F2D6C51|nr:cytochrome b [Paraburkholderia sp. ZP32-5]